MLILIHGVAVDPSCVPPSRKKANWGANDAVSSLLATSMGGKRVKVERDVSRQYKSTATVSGSDGEETVARGTGFEEAIVVIEERDIVRLDDEVDVVWCVGWDVRRCSHRTPSTRDDEVGGSENVLREEHGGRRWQAEEWESVVWRKCIAVYKEASAVLVEAVALAEARSHLGRFDKTRRCEDKKASRCYGYLGYSGGPKQGSVSLRLLAPSPGLTCAASSETTQQVGRTLIERGLLREVGGPREFSRLCR